MKYKFKIREIEPIGAVCMKYSAIVTKANKVFSNVFKTIGKK